MSIKKKFDMHISCRLTRSGDSKPKYFKVWRYYKIFFSNFFFFWLHWVVQKSTTNSLYMTTVLSEKTYDGIKEIMYSLIRKKLLKTNQSSNFLESTFNNRFNVRTLSNL